MANRNLGHIMCIYLFWYLHMCVYLKSFLMFSHTLGLLRSSPWPWRPGRWAGGGWGCGETWVDALSLTDTSSVAMSSLQNFLTLVALTLEVTASTRKQGWKEKEFMKSMAKGRGLGWRSEHGTSHLSQIPYQVHVLWNTISNHTRSISWGCR